MKNITKKSRDRPDIFELHADFCRVFTDPKRIQIISLLKEKEMTVSDIARILHISLPNVSQHLRIMRDLKAVRTRRKKRYILYRIANRKFTKGCNLIREGLVEEYQKQGKID